MLGRPDGTDTEVILDCMRTVPWELGDRFRIFILDSRDATLYVNDYHFYRARERTSRKLPILLFTVNVEMCVLGGERGATLVNVWGGETLFRV